MVYANSYLALSAVDYTSDGERIATMTRERVERALCRESNPARRSKLFARSAMLKLKGK